LARIYIGGAGGAPSNNFIKSLRLSSPGDYLIGASSNPLDLFLAATDERHIVPQARDPYYAERVLELLSILRPDFMHVQHDYEVQAVARIRDEVERLGVRLFLPATATIDRCVDKFLSYELWKASGLRVPETIAINRLEDLEHAFSTLGPTVWVRARTGGGGEGALPTESLEFARLWIDRHHGWGRFSAAECLSAKSVTWQSIWWRGQLVVAQSRLRRVWSFGNRALSGVTGITGAAETICDPMVDDVALAAIRAIDDAPHGIFGVDMTYDWDGHPCPTEINIGRFFTTSFFFARAGLNMPLIYRNLGVDEEFPHLERPINPLPTGLVWIRGMDVEPVLVTLSEIDELERKQRDLLPV
jgi:hypothetical protein